MRKRKEKMQKAGCGEVGRKILHIIHGKERR